jgi:hypothetical protein
MTDSSPKSAVASTGMRSTFRSFNGWMALECALIAAFLVYIIAPLFERPVAWLDHAVGTLIG